MRERIPNERIIEEAEYIIATNATVRQTSTCFRRSKSAVHYDMRVYLPRINKELAEQVSHSLATNLSERAIRGGKARWKAKENKKTEEM